MSVDARQESIRLIARSLQAMDQNKAFELQSQNRGRFKATVQLGTEADYLADAERILDSEIVRMAEERIMARIRTNT